MKRSVLNAAAFILLVSVSSISGQTVDEFKKDFIRARMRKVAGWQLKNPLHEPNDWTNGAFYAGVFAAWKTTKSPEIWSALMKLGEKTGWKPGTRFDHADDIVITQTYLDIYRLKKDRAMLQPTIDVVKRILTEKSTEAEKHRITWWWCDALFMAPPALAKLGRITHNKSYLALNDKLFRETYDLLYDKEEHLFARDAGYLIDGQGEGRREANGKKIFWSRGNGWVLGGLARLLSELPRNYPEYDFYKELYVQMAERIIALQQADGLWRSSLLDPVSYPGGEASGTGFYTYALAWGINNRVLDKKKYLPAVKKAWSGLNTLVHPDGRVGWTQPIGADPRKNFSADSWEVYGAGAYLLAGSEIVKLKL
jgi:rhamnogalacturonyl hydrolase YesR